MLAAMEGERREPQSLNASLPMEDVLAMFAQSPEFGGAIHELKSRRDPVVREAVFLGMLDRYEEYLQAQPDPDDVLFAHANRIMLVMAAEGATQRQINNFLYEYGYTNSKKGSVDIRQALVEQLSTVILLPAQERMRHPQDESIAMHDLFAEQPIEVLAHAVALLTGAQPNEREALKDFMIAETQPVPSLALNSGLRRLQRAYDFYAKHTEQHIFTDTDSADSVLEEIAREKRQKLRTQQALMGLLFEGEPPQQLKRRANGAGEVAHDILQKAFFGLLTFAVERQPNPIDPRKLAAAVGLQPTEDSV